jgi:hypothetical protein
MEKRWTIRRCSSNDGKYLEVNATARNKTLLAVHCKSSCALSGVTVADLTWQMHYSIMCKFLIPNFTQINECGKHQDTFILCPEVKCTALTVPIFVKLNESMAWHSHTLKQSVTATSLDFMTLMPAQVLVVNNTYIKFHKNSTSFLVTATISEMDERWMCSPWKACTIYFIQTVEKQKKVFCNNLINFM